MKPVLNLPAAKRGWRTTAARNAMFEAGPFTTKASSASASRARASSRLVPWAISLAIIES